MEKTTYSIIIETENLGMAEVEDLKKSLDSIKDQDIEKGKIKEVILIVGTHLPKDIQKEILSEYPWVTLHIDEEGLEYAESKVVGAKVASGDVLIFADSDMKYEPSWLKNMIKALEKYPSGYIISGDTRLESNSAYKMALNSMWMVQISSDKIDEPVPYKHFPLNNFAIERNAMLKNPIPYNLPLYRNKIPVWQEMLSNNGYIVLRAPGTRGFHAPPATFMDWFYRMLIYGSDFVASSDFSVNKQNKIITKVNLKKRFLKLLFLVPWKVEQMFVNTWKLLKEDGKRIKFVPFSLVLASLGIFVIALGGTIAVFNRTYVFNKISKYEEGNI